MQLTGMKRVIIQINKQLNKHIFLTHNQAEPDPWIR